MITFKDIDKEVFDRRKSDDDIFDLKASVLHGIGTTDAPLWIKKISEYGDIYDLLDSNDAVEMAKNYTGFSVTTVGWAAPLDKTQDEETQNQSKPSEHPQKRRVRLFVYCDAEGIISSSIRFKDDPENVTYDENQARGAFRDAMIDFFARKEFLKILDKVKE